ncbi:hypothetical protein BGZ76_003104 [Entomortierella beljakovae]|nr:hypothetical protein BGZ76_003104 [Entomortierella beljakovae]
MSNNRQLLVTVLLLLAAIAIVPNDNYLAAAQFGLSVPCNNCIIDKLGALPTCTGVNITDPTQLQTEKVKTCLCDASFDFNWTTPCSTSCQTNELQNFQSNFGNLLKTGLNATCVKPTPSASPSPSPSTTDSAAQSLTKSVDSRAMLGWIAVVIISVMSSMML